jgi:AraC-like DNA-binding protein
MGVYREYRAPAGLSCVWIRSTSVAGTALVVPDGCTDLIWSEASAELFIAGPDTRAHPTTLTPGRMLGVRFPPGVGPAVFGVPAHALRDVRVPASEVWHDAPALAETLVDPDRALAQLTTIAVRRLRQSSPDPLTSAVRRPFDVGSLSDGIGIGDRQLRRRCLDAFGYGPKMLHRILRFDRALRLARMGVPFAQAAADLGYADQAHLAREVRALAGVPLGVLVNRDARTRAA